MKASCPLTPRWLGPCCHSAPLLVQEGLAIEGQEQESGRASLVEQKLPDITVICISLTPQICDTKCADLPAPVQPLCLMCCIPLPISLESQDFYLSFPFRRPDIELRFIELGLVHSDYYTRVVRGPQKGIIALSNPFTISVHYSFVLASTPRIA